MPFCPQCRAEYVAGAKECKDCGVPLVDVLPPEVHEDKEDLVPVYKADTEVQAGMVLSVLQQAGIDAELYPIWDRETHSWLKLFSDPGGRWGSVVVLEHEAERAKELIRTFLESPPEGFEGEKPNYEEEP
jgi:hypothetical protein